MRRVLIAGVVVAVAIASAAPAWPQSRGSSGRRSPSPSRLQDPAPSVPGIGFDYAHLAAITPRRPISRTDPHPVHGPFIAPIFSWGWPVYSAPQPVAPQPIVIVLQQPPPAVITVPAPGAPEDAARAEAVPPPSLSPAPLRELGPFILLRRDGQIVLAVLFGASGDLLTYINQDGVRRSFPLAELDIEATQQMNEAAGRTVVLPH
jgi:hypothetical protein